MKKFICVILGSIVIGFLPSCSTKAKTVKGVSGLMAKPDCKGVCGRVMPCEGKEISLEMELRNNNVLVAGNTVWVRDPENYDNTVKLEFDRAVPLELYSGIKESKAKRLIVTGKIEGFDQYVHEICTRNYIIKVAKASDFKTFE